MTYGLDPQQFRLYVIRPTLQHLELHSQAAENLLLGTALQESNLKYIRQLGAGPALGVMQMEPATHDDLWRNYLAYSPDLALKLKSITRLAGVGAAPEMMGNLQYAVGMARVHYRRVKAAIPAAHDARALAAYWKQYYNTPLGAGTVDEAVKHFFYACVP
jgi:hypothetical protein